MSSRTVGGILVLVLLIGIVMYKRIGQAEDTGEAVKADVMLILAEVEGYEANKKFLDLSAGLAHNAAFEKAFEIARRRQAATFDQDVYMAEFFEHIINQARNGGRQDLVKSLMALRDQYDIQRPTDA